MRHARRGPDTPASDLLPGERREAGDHAGELVPAGGPLPAPAKCFGITDPQQWIDLCG